jgi:hypothetical protein
VGARKANSYQLNGNKLAFSHGSSLFAVSSAEAFHLGTLPPFSRLAVNGLTHLCQDVPCVFIE